MNVFGAQTKALPDVMSPLLGQPSIGDLDQDGVPDIIASGASPSVKPGVPRVATRADRAQHMLALWSGRTGHMLPGSPVVLEGYTFLVNPAIADVSGDAYPEVITGTGGYFLHAVDGCGREAEGFPKFTNGWIAASAAVGDIDGDASRSLEVVTGTRDGWLFAWTTKGRASGAVQWESFHHDNANTGNYGTKLDQGSRARAAKPLECPAPTTTSNDRFEAGGGCTCRTGAARSSGVASAGAVGGLVVALTVSMHRRRRRVERARSRHKFESMP
jgi:hypothetical protein